MIAFLPKIKQSEREIVMEQRQCPSTVEQILEWKCKCKTPDNEWSNSVEEFQKQYTTLCGGEDVTDVLYSFLGIYAIGVWVFNHKELNSDIFKIDKIRIRVKNENNEYQYLCSKNFLLKIQTNKINNIDVSKLNICIDPYAKLYFKAGNLIPMWPGGNTKKGNQNNGYMDIPELFFKKYYKWFILLMKDDHAFLEDINKFMIEKEKHLVSFTDFIEYVGSENNYKEYIKHIVNVIDKRTKNIAEAVNREPKKAISAYPLSSASLLSPIV
jgi:hypothetical protein